MAGRRANSRLLSALRVIAVLLLLLVLLVATVCVDAGPSSKQPKLGRPKGTPRKVDETVPDVDEILIVGLKRRDLNSSADRSLNPVRSGFSFRLRTFAIPDFKHNNSLPLYLIHILDASEW